MPVIVLPGKDHICLPLVVAEIMRHFYGSAFRIDIDIPAGIPHPFQRFFLADYIIESIEILFRDFSVRSHQIHGKMLFCAVQCNILFRHRQSDVFFINYPLRNAVLFSRPLVCAVHHPKTVVQTSPVSLLTAKKYNCPSQRNCPLANSVSTYSIFSTVISA